LLAYGLSQVSARLRQSTGAASGTRPCSAQALETRAWCRWPTRPACALLWIWQRRAPGKLKSRSARLPAASRAGGANKQPP